MGKIVKNGISYSGIGTSSDIPYTNSVSQDIKSVKDGIDYAIQSGGGSDLQLGETSTTAYRGDRGKVAYEHSQLNHARADATKTQASTINGYIVIDNTETKVYTHPTYTSTSEGLYKVTVDSTGHISNTTEVTKSDITSLGIPESDTTYSVVTTSDNGLMSSADKTKLDGIDSGANKTVVTNTLTSTSTTNALSAAQGKALKELVDGKSDIGHTHSYIPTTEKGASSGVATLGDDGKIPVSQLPSYVDSVVEYSSKSSFPTTGEAGKIYVDTSDNRTYRWSGSTYIEIGPSIVIGTTTGTALDGKVGNDHITSTSNPHSVTKSQIGLGNVENKSSATIRGELTKSNVTTALGYTPPTTDTTYSVVTTSSNGLMSSSDKSKLDGIASGANNYSLPKASTSTLGGIKVGANLSITSDGTLNATDTKSDIPVINVIEKGVSHDFVDQTANIQSIINGLEGPAILFFEAGYYRLDGYLKLNKSNVTFSGYNATFLALSSTINYIFYISNYNEGQYAGASDEVNFVENIRFEGIKFTGKNAYVIEARGVKNLSLTDLVTDGGLISIDQVHQIDYSDGTTDPSATGGITLNRLNQHIFINNCIADRHDATESEHPDTTVKGIYCNYCNDVHITNCYLYGHGQGIECWGGNALYNYSGHWKAQQWCKNIFVTDCRVDFVRGGGIWGSQCENMIIKGCSVSRCNDVGYDFESCRTSTVADSVVKNCKTSNISTYSDAQNIVFKNVMSYMDSDGCDLHYLHNNSSLQPATITVTLEGCTFTSNRGSYGITQLDPFKHMVVRDCNFFNVCWNCKISSDGAYTKTDAGSFPNQMFTTFVNNRMRYDVIASPTLTKPPFSAMIAATVNGYYQCIVSDNDIYNEESTSAGYNVGGIFINKSSSLPDVVVENNKIDSCSSQDIKFGSLVGNVLVKGNVLKHGMGTSTYVKKVNNYTFDGSAI